MPNTPEIQRLVLPVPPSANRYWRHDRGRTHLSGDAVAYRKTVSILAYSAGVKPIKGPVVLSLVWFRARRQGDVDNRLKQAIDSCRSILYLDDSQIVELRIRREEDPDNPRLIVAAAPDGTLEARQLAEFYQSQIASRTQPNANERSERKGAHK